MFKTYKDKLYNKLVHTYPEVRAHYEGYKDSNPEYHKKHRLRSLKFLRQLNKYYKNGKKGDFPKPPRDYTVKGSDIFVYADRQEPEQTVSVGTQTPANAQNKAKPAGAAPAPAPQPAAPAPKPPAPSAKPPVPAAKPAPAPKQSSSPVAPYLEKAESEKAKRSDPYRFVALHLMSYDVISFDIFDTLILRKLDQPTDVFMLVEEKLKIYDFYKIRQRAEKEVRQKQKLLNGHSEVTLEAIYDRVAYYTGIEPQEAAETEFQTECDMCFANPYFKRVFELCKANGKRIFATSNMYLTKERMQKLLLKCGYDGFEDILVSCDYKCSKNNGDLFKILISKAGTSNIAHIGDNQRTDIVGATSIGIEAKYYPNCRELGTPHRASGISPLISATYKGIVNTTIHNGAEKYTLAWEYGFIYGGLAALGYVNWIHEKAISDSAQKILFMARDGYIWKSIYDMLFDDIPSEYVFWSRLAALKNISEGDRQMFISRMIEELCNTGATIGDMLELSGITSLKSFFEKHKFLSDVSITEINKTELCNFIVYNWNIIEEALQETKNSSVKYLKTMVGNAKKVSIVDIGWLGRNLVTLKKILLSQGVEAKIYMFGNRIRYHCETLSLTKSISSYMFSNNMNREIFDYFNKNPSVKIEIMEKIYNAPHCSFIGFENDEMLFKSSEIQNYRIYKEIEDGIMAFCQKYSHAFSCYPYLMNISGYDAFIPIRMLLNNLKYSEKAIGTLRCFLGGVSSKNELLLEDVIKGRR